MTGQASQSGSPPGPASSGPMDLMAVYLAASQGVGQRMKLETIDKQLRSLPLEQSLLFLGELAQRVDLAGLDRAAHTDIARRALPSGAFRAAEELLRRDHPRTGALSSQVLVLLGIRLLAVNDGSAPYDGNADRLGRRLGGLALALADHVDSGPLSVETTILEVVRLGLFFSTSEHPGWLSLAGRLFFDVLPALPEHPDWMDPLGSFRARTGIDLDRFWAITVMQGMAASESFEHFRFPVNITEFPIPDDELGAWRGLLAQSPSSAADAARADVTKPTGWSMSSVWKRPVIELWESRGCVLRPRLLAMQAEPAQMFWHVRDAIVDDEVTHTHWSGLYGGAVERLGVTLAQESLLGDTVLDEAAFAARWSIPDRAKRGDLAVITRDRDLVVADFVGRQFTVKSTSTGDFSALSKDLKLGITEKLPQLDATLAFALASGEIFRSLIPLAITAGPLPYIPQLDPIIDAGLEQYEMRVIGHEMACRKWIAMDLLNFSLLLRASHLLDRSLGELIDDWQSSGLARNTFRAWLLLDSGANLPAGGFDDDWRDRVNSYLLRPSPDGP